MPGIGSAQGPRRYSLIKISYSLLKLLTLSIHKIVTA